MSIRQITPISIYVNRNGNVMKLSSEAKGEQPDEAIDSLPGALRRDFPHSKTDKETK